MAIPLVIGLAVFLAVPLSSPLPAPTPASAWFVYHVDSASERWAYDLAVDASGNPHIGAVECCNVDSLVARSLYAHWGYGAWSESTVIEYPDIYMFVEQPQVVVGPSGAVKIYESRHESLWNKSYLYETVPAPSQLRGWSMTPLDGPFDLIYDLKAA